MRTPSLVDEKYAALVELFPNAVTESIGEDGVATRAIDADVLAQEINSRVVSGKEDRYQFTWPDKKKAVLLSNLPIAATLRPCREESVDFDNTENLYIEGDNLDVLKLLRETYLNRVKMIYIDPPYNTGNDFVYEDDFAEDADEFLIRDGQYNEYGERLVLNPNSNGRFHSNWLTMLFPRLRQARQFLTDDGAIFVSCDEGEHPRLRLMMDEIFGGANFIADMVWAAGRKNDSQLISVSHEYIVCYARNVEFLRTHKILWRQRKKGLDEIYAEYNRLKEIHRNDFMKITIGMKAWYKKLADSHPSKAHKHYCHVDARGVYFPADISWPGGGGPKYEVLHPRTNKPVKIPSRGWMTSDPQKMRTWIADNLVHFGEDENSVPCIKKYLKDGELQTPYSVFYQDGRASSKRLRALLDSAFFDFPKDEFVLQELVGMLTGESDVVFDFFSGSATTAHAVMQLNAEDGGKRKFIMVQLPEVCDEDSEAAKAGYKNICEIGKERIRRAGAKIKADSPLTTQTLDTGFRVLKLDSSNMEDVYYTPKEALAEATKRDGRFESFIDNIKPDRKPEDLLFQVMLDLGIPLSAKIKKQKIDSTNIFTVADNHLAACFDRVTDAILTAIAQSKPKYAVFRDSGFQSDATLVNFEQIFKTYSPDTIRKVL